jgi:hypothetical protein
MHVVAVAFVVVDLEVLREGCGVRSLVSIPGNWGLPAADLVAPSVPCRRTAFDALVTQASSTDGVVRTAHIAPAASVSRRDHEMPGLDDLRAFRTTMSSRSLLGKSGSLGVAVRGAR